MHNPSVISPLVISVCHIKVAAILLAAGQASRFGSAKQLALIDGQTLLNRTIEQYAQSSIDSLLVVLGAQYQRIADSISSDVHIVHCQQWQLGMSESIESGLNCINQDSTHAIIGLADQINLKCAHIDQLIKLSKANPKNIIAAKYNDILGSPAIFPQRYFSDLQKLCGDKGARALLQQNSGSVVSYNCPELACDIDSRQDLIDWQNII